MRLLVFLILLGFPAAHAISFEKLNDTGMPLKKMQTVPLSSGKIQADYRFGFLEPRSGKMQHFVVQAVASKNRHIEQLLLKDVREVTTSQHPLVFNVVLRMASLCFGFAPSGISMDFLLRVPTAKQDTLQVQKSYGDVKLAYLMQKGILKKLSYQLKKPKTSACTL